MHYGYTSLGWYAGEVPDDTPDSTPIPPDNLSTTTTLGELRAKWWRFAWTDTPYAVRTETRTQPCAPNHLGIITQERVLPDGEWVTVSDTCTLRPPHITKLAFRNRYTPEEKINIELASLDVPTAPMAQRRTSAALRAALADQRDAEYIDLSRADLRTGVQNTEALGLIAKGRAAEILSLTISDAEYIPI